MSDYTQLRGVTNFNDSELSNEIESNLVMFFDWGLVNAGAYSNVRLSTTDIRSSNKSRLRKSNDPKYTGLNAYECFHNNLVYESGLLQGGQINISGVYVNGTFSTASGTYAHYVDYNNGVVVFSSGLPTNPTINMEYSYKNVQVIEGRNVPFIRNLQFNTFDISTSNFLVGSGDWTVNGDRKITMPFIAFETVGSTPKPYEIGSKNTMVHHEILAHVFSTNDNDTKKIADIISKQYAKTFYLLDIDTIAASGDFALDYRGALVSNKNYPDLVGSDGSLYRKSKIHVASTEITNSYWISPKCHHSIVKIKLETINRMT